MSDTRKWILWLFLGAVAALALLTWGSVGSAMLTMGLLLAGAFLLTRHLVNRDSDYDMDQ